MNLNYELTYLDFLEYQLYTSSKSKLHKKNRFKSRIILPIIYLIFGLYTLYISQNIMLGVIFAGIALLWFTFHPLYSKWKYKKHFKKHIKENYKNRINKLVKIDIEENLIKAKGISSESIINMAEINELIETKEHFFIKLVTDTSLIVPKHAVVSKTEFMEKITGLGAQYVNELNWEWK